MAALEDVFTPRERLGESSQAVTNYGWSLCVLAEARQAYTARGVSAWLVCTVSTSSSGYEWDWVSLVKAKLAPSADALVCECDGKY